MITAKEDQISNPLPVTFPEISFQTMVEEANVGIFVAMADGNYIFVNRYGCEMLGYSREELLKMNFRDVISEDELREKPLMLNKMLPGSQVILQRNLIRKDRTVLPVEINGKILSDGKLQGIIRDISQQKKAEKALLESEANYKHAESIAHLGSWQMNIKTGKSKWSDEFFRICGFEPQSFEPTRELRYLVLHPDDREIFQKAVQKAISEKGSYRVQKRVLRPNGEIRYVLSVGEVILNENDEPDELKGVFLDITEMKKIEFSLKELSEKLQDLNATKDKFFSIIAHDLKNPFNSIIGFSELLLKGAGEYSQAEILKFAAIIHDASQKTYNLLENMLLWSRSQTGTLEYDPDLYSIPDLIRDNIDFVSPVALKKQIRIAYESSGVRKVWVDKNMIDTVFRNILTNAVKFSYPGSDIVVKDFENERYCGVSIQDHGIGIDPENLGRLFRLDNKFSSVGTNREKGTGLGLLISKEFIEKNQGQIQVFSEPGKGTKFQVLLPKTKM